MAEPYEIAFAIESQRRGIARAVAAMARQAREQKRLNQELEEFRRRHEKPKTADEVLDDWRDFQLWHPWLCEKEEYRRVCEEVKYLRNAGHPRYRRYRIAMLIALPLLCLVVVALQLAAIATLLLHLLSLP